MASLIRKRVGGDAEHNREFECKSKILKSRTSEESLGAIVASKIEDGNLRAAVRILCSESSEHSILTAGPRQ